MFTKMPFPIANFYFMESRPAPMLRNISPGWATRTHDRPWIALSLVLCAHLAMFAVLRPEPQPLSVEPIPDPIMVSLLSAPQTAPQKPIPPAVPIERAQKPVKTPDSKPVAPHTKRPSLPTAPPVEQTSMPTAATSAPAAEPEAQTTNNKTSDTQTYQVTQL